jgi:hypothetical protein
MPSAAQRVSASAQASSLPVNSSQFPGPARAADQLRDRGVLQRARRGLGAVQRADDARQLIITGTREPVIRAGRVLRQPVQRRPAGSAIESVAGRERPGGAG